MAPKTAKLAPKTAKLVPKTAKLAAKTAKLTPKTAKLAAKMAKLPPRMAKLVPKTHCMSEAEWRNLGGKISLLLVVFLRDCMLEFLGSRISLVVFTVLLGVLLA